MTITEFDDLVRGHNPFCLAVGPEGRDLWATDDIDQDAGESRVVRITLDGTRTGSFAYGDSAYPAGTDIVAGPDGNMWFADEGDGNIGRMTTRGVFTLFHLPGAGSPDSLAAGSDGALWFTTDRGTPFPIGRITTGGVITGFSQGVSPGAGVTDIAPGPDGALWFTEIDGNRIGRITTAGVVTEYANGLSMGSGPTSIAPGPDGAMWFTEAAGRIGRITTSGAITEYAHGISRREVPNDLAAGPDGAIWFTESRGTRRHGYPKIGRITVDGTITEYVNGMKPRSEPTCIVAGPDGNMWFTDSSNHNRIGRVNLQNLRESAPVSNGAFWGTSWPMPRPIIRT